MSFRAQVKATDEWKTRQYVHRIIVASGIKNSCLKAATNPPEIDRGRHFRITALDRLNISFLHKKKVL